MSNSFKEFPEKITRLIKLNTRRNVVTSYVTWPFPSPLVLASSTSRTDKAKTGLHAGRQTLVYAYVTSMSWVHFRDDYSQPISWLMQNTHQPSQPITWLMLTKESNRTTQKTAMQQLLELSYHNICSKQVFSKFSDITWYLNKWKQMKISNFWFLSHRVQTKSRWVEGRRVTYRARQKK